MKVAIIGTQECLRTQNIVAALHASRYNGDILIVDNVNEIKEGNVVVITDEIASLITPKIDLKEVLFELSASPRMQEIYFEKVEKRTHKRPYKYHK